MVFMVMRIKGVEHSFPIHWDSRYPIESNRLTKLLLAEIVYRGESDISELFHFYDYLMVFKISSNVYRVLPLVF